MTRPPPSERSNEVVSGASRVMVVPSIAAIVRSNRTSSVPGSHFSQPPASPGANRSIPSDAIQAAVLGMLDDHRRRRPGGRPARSSRRAREPMGTRSSTMAIAGPPSGGAGPPRDLDQGPAVGPPGDDDRPARPVPLAPEDDARRPRSGAGPTTSWRPALRTTAPRRPRASGGSAETRSIAAWIARRVVPGRGLDDQPDRGVGDRHAPAPVAAGGEVGDAVAPLVGPIDQLAVGPDLDGPGRRVGRPGGRGDREHPQDRARPARPRRLIEGPPARRRG